MLCGDCRVYYKKYGFDKVILDRPPTPPELVRLREEQNQKATVEDDVSYSQKKHTVVIIQIKKNARQKDIKVPIHRCDRFFFILLRRVRPWPKSGPETLKSMDLFPRSKTDPGNNGPKPTDRKK